MTCVSRSVAVRERCWISSHPPGRTRSVQRTRMQMEGWDSWLFFCCCCFLHEMCFALSGILFKLLFKTLLFLHRANSRQRDTPDFQPQHEETNVKRNQMSHGWIFLFDEMWFTWVMFQFPGSSFCDKPETGPSGRLTLAGTEHWIVLSSLSKYS